MSQTELTRVAESYLSAVVKGRADKLVELAGTNGFIDDPRFPGNEGETQIRAFVAQFQGFIANMSPTTEHLRTTVTARRVICEDFLHIDNASEKWELPVATVAAPDPATNAIRIHVYYTNWPFNKKHSARRNLYTEQQPDRAEFEGAILRHVQSLLSGDLDKIRESFEPDIYFREASGVP